MTVPIEAKTFRYTPEFLEGKEGAPVFVLRYGTRRDKAAYRDELAARGVIYYPPASIRQTTLAEIRRLSNNAPEAIEKMVDTAQRYWDSEDAYQKMAIDWVKECDELRTANPEAELPPPPINDFSEDERIWIVGILDQVQAESPVLARMRRANSRQERDGEEVALALLLLSVEGFEITRGVDGLIDPDGLGALQEWLGDLSESLGVDVSESDIPYMQLRRTAFAAFYNPKEAEKNFASPLQPSSPEDSSKQDGPAAGDTPSTGSAKSKLKTTPSETDTTAGESSATPPCDAEDNGAELSGQTAEASLTSQNA